MSFSTLVQDTTTQVREHVCKHNPVHVLEVLEICGDCDEGSGDDRGVYHRKQKTAEHADKRSVVALHNSNGACFDYAHNMMMKPRRAPVTCGGGGGRLSSRESLSGVVIVL